MNNNPDLLHWKGRSFWHDTSERIQLFVYRFSGYKIFRPMQFQPTSLSISRNFDRNLFLLFSPNSVIRLSYYLSTVDSNESNRLDYRTSYS